MIIALIMTIISTIYVAPVDVEYNVSSFTPTGETYIRAGITEFKLYTTDEESTFVYNNVEYVIEAGFETDLATIPHWFWNIVNPTDLAEAAIIHDWLYDTHDHGLSMDEADAIFKGMILDTDHAHLTTVISVLQRAIFQIVTQEGR